MVYERKKALSHTLQKFTALPHSKQKISVLKHEDHGVGLITWIYSTCKAQGIPQLLLNSYVYGLKTKCHFSN